MTGVTTDPLPAAAAPSHKTHRVVVVGGGAGGIELVTRLGDRLGRHSLADIALIERARTHLWSIDRLRSSAIRSSSSMRAWVEPSCCLRLGNDPHRIEPHRRIKTEKLTTRFAAVRGRHFGRRPI
jgi:hypothetical protein